MGAKLPSIAAIAISTIAACALVAGVDGDYIPERPSAGGAADGGSGGVAGSGGTTTSTSGGGGVAGAPDCGPDIDTTADPRHCGLCGNACDKRELCIDSACVCRPDLTLIAGVCVNTHNSDQHCGTEDNECETAGADFCEAGFCVAVCSDGLEECGDGCIDTTSDHDHCDGCSMTKQMCDSWEVCVTGECRAWIPATSCTSCPCPLCDGHASYNLCCPYPAKPDLITCVDAAACP